jgi:LuxR family transcriptional regulator, maltose regulon positive regulatory protein
MNNQNPPLVISKLRVPHTIPGVIARTALQNHLLQTLDHVSVCLVTAPAGFGKTTLVSQTLRLWNHRASWLQLDAEDNDPTKFWVYVVSALQNLHPELPPYTSSMDISPGNYEPLIQIANALEKVNEPFALVLDDFHHITSEAIYRQLEWFISRELPTLRLILISRVESPLNLARIQVRHQLETLGAEILRFTKIETVAFLRDTMALDVKNTVVEQLWEISEGWPAALHLLALGLRNHNELAFARQFAFSDANLAHYFDEEVFNPLAPAAQDFLLRTALLGDLHPELCQAVTGLDSWHFLEQLTNNQLFVTQLDDEGQHYRYHSLFAEYLQARVKRDHPDWIHTTHQLAAEYYRQRKQIQPAIEHALLSENYVYAENLICDNAWNLITSGMRDTVGLWFERIPSEYLKTKPRLSVCYAWVIFLQGQFDRAKHYLGRLEEEFSLNPDSLSAKDQQIVIGEIYTLRAHIAHLEGHLVESIEHAQQAVRVLPEDQTLMRTFALVTLGYTQWMEGNATAAQQPIDDEMLFAYMDDPLTRLLLQCNQANMLILLGNLHEAAQMLEKLLVGAEAEPPKYQLVAAITHIELGLLNYAWNNLNLAADHVRTGLKLGQPWVYMSVLLPGYITLFRIEQARNRTNAAERVLNELERHIQTGHLVPMEELLEINRLRLEIARNNFAPARRWALRFDELDTPLGNDSIAIWRYLTYVEVMLVEGNAVAAESILDLLKRLNSYCGILSLAWMQLDVQLLQCVAHWIMGHKAPALNLLQDTISRAEPEHHIRLFLDRGTIIETMLHHLEAPTNYIRELIEAFEEEPRSISWIAYDLAPTSKSSEILSAREREILFLIGEGATNGEVAERLVIAEGTVKTHVKHILRKLNAQNRTEAITKARARSLID